MALELDNRQRAMLQEMGVRVWLPDSSFETLPAPLPPPQPLQTKAPQSPLEVPRVRTPQAAELALASHGLEALVQSAASCQACGLCAGRKRSTLCAPAPAVQTDWLVLGDPPDEDEERAGHPFAEQAGRLLDNMLKAVGVQRNGSGPQGAYLTNVVKCRPPMSRLPQAAELAQCAAFLQREIALVQPRLILAMGRFAIQLLLGGTPQGTLPLGKQRGTVYRYAGLPVVVTYHPQVLLRASADKAKAWADLCLAVQAIRDSDPAYNQQHDVS